MRRTPLVLALALTTAAALFLASPEHRVPNQDTAIDVGQPLAPEAYQEAYAYVPMAPTSIAASIRDNAQTTSR